MSDRTLDLYLEDVLDAVNKIEGYVRGMTKEQFAQDAKTIDAVIRNIEIIGEAARKIPEVKRLQHPTVPWKQVIGARNKAIHEYFGIDIDILWKTIQEDISNLKEETERMRKETNI